MQTLQMAFFAETATTNTGYDGVVRKTCEKVITNQFPDRDDIALIYPFL